VSTPDYHPPIVDIDAPVTADEVAAFRDLQERFACSFSEIFADSAKPRTVLIIPSLTLDQQVMARISGAHHYEERMLCLLLLLRMPRTRVIYVTSTPTSETIIDYYLHLLPGIPGVHARRRLTLISCNDASPVPLARKILERPRVLDRIREAIPDRASAHMTCFTVTELERKLALTLSLPIYGCDPSLLHLGSKSGSRKIFREAQIESPLGYEDLADADDLTRGLAELKRRKPTLSKAVVKLNEGFSGEGNAIFDLTDAPASPTLLPWIRERLPRLAFEARGMTWDLYEDKLLAMAASSRNSFRVQSSVHRPHSSESTPSAGSVPFRRTTRYSAAPPARFSSVVVFRLSGPIGSTSRRAAPRLPGCSPRREF